MVVPDAQTYATQLSTIKSFNMLPIIDIEVPIWNGGQLQKHAYKQFLRLLPITQKRRLAVPVGLGRRQDRRSGLDEELLQGLRELQL